MKRSQKSALREKLGKDTTPATRARESTRRIVRKLPRTKTRRAAAKAVKKDSWTSSARSLIQHSPLVSILAGIGIGALTGYALDQKFRRKSEVIFYG